MKAKRLLLVTVCFISTIGFASQSEVPTDPVERLIKYGPVSANKEARRAWEFQELTTLKGIKKMCVLTQYTSLTKPEDRFPINLDKIRTVINLKLKLAGIEQVSSNQILTTPGSPILVVRYTVNDPYDKESSKKNVDVMASLYQKMILERDRRISYYSTTWFEMSTFRDVEVDIGAITIAIRDCTAEVMDEFINDYLAANPKEPVKTLEELTEEKKPKDEQAELRHPEE